MVIFEYILRQLIGCQYSIPGIDHHHFPAKYRIAHGLLCLSKLMNLLKKGYSDGKVKSSSSRRRKSHVMMCTYRTPQTQRDEAQRRNRTFYEAVKIQLLKKRT